MRTKTMFCIECNKKLTYETTKLCRTCWIKANLLKFPKCIDCDKQLKTKDAIRCLSCSNKINSQLSSKFEGKHCSEEHKEKMRKVLTGQSRLMLRGRNHYNWKGGISPLSISIRQCAEGIQWRTEVFKRDNYTCQECKVKGCSLEAHHIKPFNIIFKEFLEKYNNLSPIDDKDLLFQLALRYDDFWDLFNGQTLCEDCHKLETSKK